MLEGVGMVIQPDHQNQLVVKSLSENGDAAASGLVQIGDIVYSINGNVVFRSPTHVVRDLILGPTGTEVTIGLLRDNVVMEATLRRGSCYGPASHAVDPAMMLGPRDSRQSTRVEPNPNMMMGYNRDSVMDSSRSSMQNIMHSSRDKPFRSAAPSNTATIISSSNNNNSVNSTPPIMQERSPSIVTDRKTQSTNSDIMRGSANAGSMPCGIGILLIPDKNGQLTVVGMNPGGPAKRTGQIKIGDVLHSVDNEIVVGMPVEHVRPLILGPPGSEVVVNLQRPGQQQLVKVRLTRVRMRPNEGEGPASATTGTPVISTNINSTTNTSVTNTVNSNASLRSSAGDAARRSIDNYSANPNNRIRVDRARASLDGSTRTSLDSARRNEYSDLDTNRRSNTNTASLGNSSTMQPNPRDSLNQAMNNNNNNTNVGRHSMDSYGMGQARTGSYRSNQNSVQPSPRSSVGGSMRRSQDTDEVGGIGAYLVPEASGCFVVKGLTPGGAAAREGQLRVGDIVRQINGRSITGASMESVRQLVKGPPGSTITLGISHSQPGSDVKKIIDVVIIREGMGDRGVAASIAPSSRQSQDSILRGARSLQASLDDRHGIPSGNASVVPPIAAPPPADIYNNHDMSRGSLPPDRATHIGHNRRTVLRDSMEPKAGVGIILFQDSAGNLVVRNLVDMGPADRSGRIAKGDILCEVDGCAVFGFSVNDVRPMMLGEPGSLVTLRLQRARDRSMVNITLARELPPSHDAAPPQVPMRLSHGQQMMGRESFTHVETRDYSQGGMEKYMSAPQRPKQTMEQLL